MVTNSCRWSNDLVLSFERTGDIRVRGLRSGTIVTSDNPNFICLTMDFITIGACFNETLCNGGSYFISGSDNTNSSCSAHVWLWKCNVVVMWSLVVSITKGEVKCYFTCMFYISN